MSADPSTGRPGASAWKVALGVVVAALLVIGVGLLIARAAGFAEVRDAIAQADSTWFLVCFVAQVVALAGYAAVVREAFRWNDVSLWCRSDGRGREQDQSSDRRPVG